MRNLFLFMALAAPVVLGTPVLGAHHEGRGLNAGSLGRFKHSLSETEPHDHDHDHDHDHHEDQSDAGEATVTDAPSSEEEINPDLLSSSLYGTNMASALEPADQNMTDESAEASEEGQGEGSAHHEGRGLNTGAFGSIFGRHKHSGVPQETPDARHADWSSVTPPPPPTHATVDPWGTHDPWTRHQQSFYQDPYASAYHYDPYAEYGYGGYDPYDPYGYSSHDYSPYSSDHYECPKCHCDKHDEDDYHPEENYKSDHEEEEHHADEKEEHYSEPLWTTAEDEDHPHSNEIEDYQTLDDYLRTAKDDAPKTKGRSKRSVADYFDWHSVHKPSRFLAQHNVGYRIKNDLRHHLREEKFPLHYGHILTTGSKYGKRKRSFDDYADFHVGYEADAFSNVPIGPKLDKYWIDHGFPVYGYNLYKLWKPVYGVSVTKKLVRTHGARGREVKVKPGVYRFVAVMDDLKGLIIEKVGGKYHHQRYILSHIFYDGTLHKFQALAAWKDHHAKFVQVYNKTWGLVYLVRPSALLQGGNPKVKNYGKHGHHRFSHLKYEPSLLRPENFHHQVKLTHHKYKHIDHHQNY